MLIAVPFRDGGCPWRRQAWERVGEHLAELGPVRTFDDGGELFARGASLNMAFETTDADIVIACDADLIIPHDALTRAVEMAAAPGLVQPFDMLHYLDQSGCVQYRWGVSPTTPLLGGCNVLSRETWERAGGWNDEFRGWGCEDMAFATACARVAPTRRLSAVATHLYHPKAGEYASKEVVGRNGELLRRINAR